MDPLELEEGRNQETDLLATTTLSRTRDRPTTYAQTENVNIDGRRGWGTQEAEKAIAASNLRSQAWSPWLQMKRTSRGRGAGGGIW